MNKYNGVIEEICNEKNISLSKVSKDWIMVLEKDGVSKYICGYKFPLNSHSVGEITDDKYGLYSLLKKYDLPTIEYNILYRFNSNYDYAKGCNSLDYVTNLFYKYNEHIVIKTNNGSCGSDVYEISDVNDIEPLLDKLFKKYASVSVCPFYEIKNEYRIIILDEKVKLLYKKVRPEFIGDGVTTVKEFLINFNEHYFDKLDLSKYDYILEKDRKFLYSWKHNLSNGAICQYVLDENLKDELSKLALSISNKIGLRFGSVDIIETNDNKKLVMEINSGVMMDNFIEIMDDGYKIAKEIYEEAIDLMFKD